MGYPDILDYDYRIMENAVTNAQYAEFLITLLENGELNTEMGLDNAFGYYEGDAYLEEGDYTFNVFEEGCGISTNGTTYIVNEGEGNKSANCVTWLVQKLLLIIMV